MENYCTFVSSRGILKSCSFHSENPKSSCNSDKKYLYNMIKDGKMFDGMSIYVCSDLLKHFVSYILPQIQNNFILVSGDSDLCVPIEALTKNETFALLNNKFLIKWFIQNTRIYDNEKIIQLPIGLDYHTIHNNPRCSWSDTILTPKKQEEMLIYTRNLGKPFSERDSRIYAHFSIGNDRFNQRRDALKTIPRRLMVVNKNNITRDKLWLEMIKYAFILSPFGVGMDCHRTWEALCLGCIPIVCAPNFKQLFKDLPVLVVNSWDEINEELLIRTLKEYSTKTFDMDKLTMKYWANEILGK